MKKKIYDYVKRILLIIHFFFFSLAAVQGAKSKFSEEEINCTVVYLDALGGGTLTDVPNWIEDEKKLKSAFRRLYRKIVERDDKIEKNKKKISDEEISRLGKYILKKDIEQHIPDNYVKKDELEFGWKIAATLGILSSIVLAVLFAYDQYKKNRLAQ
ncbi:MAG: hypothetical protein AAF770_02445 [Bacteroidota bacterium]